MVAVELFTRDVVDLLGKDVVEVLPRLGAEFRSEAVATELAQLPGQRKRLVLLPQPQVSGHTARR